MNLQMHIDATIHVHVVDDKALQPVQERLDLLLTKINRVLTQGDKLMALSQSEVALLARLNDATNAVAVKLQALADANQDDAELNAALTALADRLTGLGADPQNPVPPEPQPEA